MVYLIFKMFDVDYRILGTKYNKYHNNIRIVYFMGSWYRNICVLVVIPSWIRDRCVNIFLRARYIELKQVPISWSRLAQVPTTCVGGGCSGFNIPVDRRLPPRICTHGGIYRNLAVVDKNNTVRTRVAVGTPLAGLTGCGKR